MRCGNARRWRACVGGFAGVGLFGWMLYFVLRHGRELQLDWSGVQPAYAALSILLVIATNLAFIAGWRQLAEHAGLHATPQMHAIRWGLSVLGKYVPGKIWQGVGRIALYKPRRWYPGAVAIVVEAVIQLGLGATLAGLLLLVTLPRVPVWVPVASLAMGVTVFVWFASRRMRELFAQVTGLSHFASRKPIPAATVCSVIGWHAVAYAAMVPGYLAIVQAIGFDAATLAPALAGALLFGGAVGLLAFVVPAGLGVRDGVIAWILLGWLSAPNAMLLALVSRLWLMTGDALIVAVVTVILLHRRRSQAPSN